MDDNNNVPASSSPTKPVTVSTIYFSRGTFYLTLLFSSLSFAILIYNSLVSTERLYIVHETITAVFLLSFISIIVELIRSSFVKNDDQDQQVKSILQELRGYLFSFLGLSASAYIFSTIIDSTVLKAPDILLNQLIYGLTNIMFLGGVLLLMLYLLQRFIEINAGDLAKKDLIIKSPTLFFIPLTAIILLGSIWVKNRFEYIFVTLSSKSLIILGITFFYIVSLSACINFLKKHHNAQPCN